jgi:hypothetical protein
MRRISAGNNLTIDIEANRWRLLANGDGLDRVLFEASTGNPLRYMPTFGHRRRLPETGALPTNYIQRVVLGWSFKDESWHLGLMLEPELADARGSRWCEIAHWPDPDRDVYVDIASEAGEKLAQALTRPFNLVPPREPEAPPPPAPLPELPVKLDLWTLEQTNPTTLTFTRSSAWGRSKLLRILWYSFWAVIYVGLSVLTLNGSIALPRPEFLPYLGLVSAGVLILTIFYQLYQLLNQADRIVVDSVTRTIYGCKGQRERWRLNPEDINSIYVSHIINRKSRQNKYSITYGELNVLLTSGRFYFLMDMSQFEDKSLTIDDGPAEEKVIPLLSDSVATNLQTAGAHIARALDTECWYDQRLK